MAYRDDVEFSFEEFCEHYGYELGDPDAADDYYEYCQE